MGHAKFLYPTLHVGGPRPIKNERSNKLDTLTTPAVYVPWTPCTHGTGMLSQDVKTFTIGFLNATKPNYNLFKEIRKQTRATCIVRLIKSRRKHKSLAVGVSDLYDCSAYTMVLNRP